MQTTKFRGMPGKKPSRLHAANGKVLCAVPKRSGLTSPETYHALDGRNRKKWRVTRAARPESFTFLCEDKGIDPAPIGGHHLPG